jgi:hypothetical protein
MEPYNPVWHRQDLRLALTRNPTGIEFQSPDDGIRTGFSKISIKLVVIHRHQESSCLTGQVVLNFIPLEQVYFCIIGIG